MTLSTEQLARAIEAKRSRRRSMLLVSAAIVVALAVGVWLMWPPRTAITRENQAKIHEGMTLHEVEALLGGPARNETSGPVERDDDVKAGTRPFWFNPKSNVSVFWWHSDKVSVCVEIDADGSVEHLYSQAQRRARESALVAVRRWLGL